MDEDLRLMWESINDAYFAGQLTPLVGIDWGEASGPEGDGAHARYFPVEKRIVIDNMFKFSKMAILRGDKAEALDAEVAYILLIHEMVHQLLHQTKSSYSGGHGRLFLQEERRITDKIREEVSETTDADQWPLRWFSRTVMQSKPRTLPCGSAS